MIFANQTISTLLPEHSASCFPIYLESESEEPEHSGWARLILESSACNCLMPRQQWQQWQHGDTWSLISWLMIVPIKQTCPDKTLEFWHLWNQVISHQWLLVFKSGCLRCCHFGHHRLSKVWVSWSNTSWQDWCRHSHAGQIWNWSCTWPGTVQSDQRHWAARCCCWHWLPWARSSDHPDA